MSLKELMRVQTRREKAAANRPKETTMLIRVDHSEALHAIRESLRDQLKRHGYSLTDAELDDVSRNATQAVVLLDKESQ